MNINDYIKRKYGNTGSSADKGGGKSDNPVNAEETIGKYSAMSEEQLMQELFRSAEAGRQNGSLNNGMLDDFFGKVGGMLSAEQRERMTELIRQLKR